MSALLAHVSDELLGLLDGLAQTIHVAVTVLDVLHVPAERLVARAHILGERDVGVAVDGDLVVIVQRNELAQALVAGWSPSTTTTT